MHLRSLAILCLAAVLVGCPQSPAKQPAPSASPRFSCVDAYPAKKVTQQGSLVELQRIRILPHRPEFYAREEFMVNDVSATGSVFEASKAPAYFAADLIVHSQPSSGDGLSHQDFVLSCQGKPMALGGMSGSSGGEVDGVARVWGLLADPVLGGEPVVLTVTFTPRAGAEKGKPLVFTFDKLDLPKKAFFWSSGE